MSKEGPRQKLHIVEGGKGKEAPSNSDLKEFSRLRQELEVKATEVEARFEAAQMGEGTEKLLGQKYSAMFGRVKNRMEKDPAVNCYDPYNRVYLEEIKTGNVLRKYAKALTDYHEELNDLDTDFDVELLRGRSGDDVREVLAA